MNRQRKRLQSSMATQACYSNPSLSVCTHCSYLLHEIMALEAKWISIAKKMVKDPFLAEDLVYEFYNRKLPKKMHILKLNDPSFNLSNYIARMLYNFISDELYRTNRHTTIDAKYYIQGLTRDNEDLVIPGVLRSIVARDQLSYIQKHLSPNDLDLINRMLLPTWTLAEEAINAGVTPTAVRARIRRLRCKIIKLIGQPPHLA